MRKREKEKREQEKRDEEKGGRLSKRAAAGEKLHIGT